MEPLVYEPDKNVQGQLSGFLNDKVFVEDEDGTSACVARFISLCNCNIILSQYYACQKQVICIQLLCNTIEM